jgi:diapolycopene oxygenase
MGPTIVTIPSVLRRIFTEAGRRMEDYLDMVRLDPQWRCFFEDGSVLNLHQDPDVMAQTLDQFSPGTNSGAHYHKFLKMSARLNDISQRQFFYKSIGGLGDMLISRPRSTRSCSAMCSRCAWAARSRARCARSIPTRASRR